MDNMTIEWYKEGHTRALINGTGGRVYIEQEKGRSILGIAKIQKQDEGFFLCKAFNGIKNASIARLRLALKYKPVITNKHLSYIAVEIGDDLRVNCKAKGVPEVYFQWFDGNGEEIGTTSNKLYKDSYRAQGKKYSLNYKKNGADFEYYESQLAIKKVTVNDFGSRILCKAINDIGSDYKQITIRPKGKPDPPENVTFLSIRDDSVLVSWNPAFDGGYAQFFRAKVMAIVTQNITYDNSIISEPTNETSLSVDGLKAKQNYSLSITAINFAGSSSSKAITFQTSDHDESSGSALIGGSIAGGSGRSPYKIAILLIILGMSVVFVNCAFIVFCIRYKNHKWLPGENRIIERKSETTKAHGNNNMNHVNGCAANHTGKQDHSENYFHMNHFNHNDVANTIIADSITHQSCSHAVITNDIDAHCDCNQKNVEIVY